jgi:hypothetical protein
MTVEPFKCKDKAFAGRCPVLVGGTDDLGLCAGFVALAPPGTPSLRATKQVAELSEETDFGIVRDRLAELGFDIFEMEVPTYREPEIEPPAPQF